MRHTATALAAKAAALTTIPPSGFIAAMRTPAADGPTDMLNQLVASNRPLASMRRSRETSAFKCD